MWSSQKTMMSPESFTKKRLEEIRLCVNPLFVLLLTL